MDATQEARAAEINALLQKRGADQVHGTARATLVHELSSLLGAGQQAPVMLAPEKQERADEITRRLREHALDRPDAYLDVFQRRELVDELAGLTGVDGAGESKGTAP